MTEKHRRKKPRIASGFKIFGAMSLGLSTAIAFRTLIVIDHLQPDWVRPVWYFAVLGNFLFFWHRYQITQQRKHAIQDHNLIARINSANGLSPDEREALTYLLQSIKRSPENINYLIISCFSLVAIAADLIIDHFFKG
ncbi:MAG: hypothetical protein RQ753_02615 [Desulfurivibrionaceae bacterium]|nr:hypothetical protein [Desulfurivibrionaceae bacterium]